MGCLIEKNGKVREFPSSLLAEIFPLCAVAMAWTTESPIPCPPVLVLRELSGR